MKRAESAELKRLIETISEASALGPRVKHVDVEAGEDGKAGSVLRVSLQVDHPEVLEWNEVEPLVQSIEESLAAVDERFSSVYFPDAA